MLEEHEDGGVYWSECDLPTGSF